jgi:hypothetical protein
MLEMAIKKISVIQLFLGVILFLLIGLIYPTLESYANAMDSKAINFVFLLKVLYLLVGVVIELERIVELGKTRTFKLNYFGLTLSIILISISSFFPYFVLWFGFGPLNGYNPFLKSEVNSVLMVISGILLVRSLKR